MQHGLQMQLCKVMKQKGYLKLLGKEKVLWNHIEKVSKFQYQRIL